MNKWELRDVLVEALREKYPAARVQPTSSVDRGSESDWPELTFALPGSREFDITILEWESGNAV